MLDRFMGADGRRLLIDALARQSLLLGSVDLGEVLADLVELQELDPGAVLIEQGGSDNDLFFVLAGAVAILVNGRQVAVRRTEQHVGEMAVVDPGARRSATVVGIEPTVVAKITESEFARLAGAHPTLWRNLACEMADRLRQRNELVRQRNETPRVFVGSSRESLPIANAIQAGLAHDPFHVTVWTNGVFGPSEFPIEALERAAIESDFAVLVLGPDDHVTSRDVENLAPRDNVILELGLFIGAAGHRRVYLLVPRGLDVKIPTDVLGVTPVFYDADVSLTPPARVAVACSEIRDAISALGPR